MMIFMRYDDFYALEECAVATAVARLAINLESETYVSFYIFPHKKNRTYNNVDVLHTPPQCLPSLKVVI